MKRHTIEHKGRVIPFVLQRKNVKNINLRVCQDASVMVSAPEKVPYDYIEQFVQKKAAWILTSIYKVEQKKLLTREKDYKSGEIIDYLGRQYRLAVYPVSGKEEACLNRGNLYLRVHDINDVSRKEALLSSWIREQAGIVFHDSLDRMLALVNSHFAVDRPKITIRDMKTRWGSCSWNRQKITLNSRLIHFPREQIDYVVLHELAHFIHQKHDRAFYAFLSLLMPDWKSRRKSLRGESDKQV